MNHFCRLLPALACLCALYAAPAGAALDLLSAAPLFKAKIAVAGQQQDFSLAEALRKGPVVLYFFPSAFSIGCSIEAQEFAQAIEDFRAAGATVVGVSRDEIQVQEKFSRTACEGKFGVVADPDLAIAQSYDALLKTRPDYANRISYVIAPDGKIVYRYSSLQPGKHVTNTLNAVRDWQKQNAAPR